MARRRPVAAPGAAGDLPILPLELLEAHTAAQSRERSQWLRAHGIDPGDWMAFYEVLKASAAVHGKPLALDRARDRIRPRAQES